MQMIKLQTTASMLASGAPSAKNGWLRAIDTDGSIGMPSVSAVARHKRMRRRNPRSCGELLMQNEGIGQRSQSRPSQAMEGVLDEVFAETQL